MNRHHLATLLWLRWRLVANQFRKAGALNAILFAMVIGCVLVLSVGMFFVGFGLGWFGLPEASPMARLFIWVAIVLSLIFFWMIGMLIDLQRTDSLALDKFMHLPVSLSGAFLVNYASSWFKVSLIVFIPGMCGFLLGQVLGFGPQMLLAFPILFAFLVALTAVTYQFQGWLASLMTNPRRRRTVIVFVTLGFILMLQIPNFLNLSLRPWETNFQAINRRTERWTEINKQLQAKQITSDEFMKRDKEINEQYLVDMGDEERQRTDKLRNAAWLFCALFPPGWLVLSYDSLPEGAVIPTLLGTIAYSLIGALALWRAYQTTLRQYLGQGADAGRKSAVAVSTSDRPDQIRIVERVLPWVSESVSAVATSAFQSLLRAPEAKMTLIAPAIMFVVFGILAIVVEESPPAVGRPLIAYAIAAFTTMTGIQLVGNQFGYDRAGFRAYVLSPISRRDILLGKNLAVVPMTLGISLLFVFMAGCLYPMRVDRWLGVFVQVTSTYLGFCLVANLISIYAPLPMAAGAVQASSPKLVPVLIQMLGIMVLPVIVVPVLLPYLFEVLYEELDLLPGLPISLILSLGVLVGMILLYRRLLTWEGNILAAREQAVLAIVTSRSE